MVTVPLFFALESSRLFAPLTCKDTKIKATRGAVKDTQRGRAVGFLKRTVFWKTTLGRRTGQFNA